ncbi:hypothetical protein [Micromonospora sp. KLBMP9576]|uniref:hypothetical protein n=1 Tax=Micromonospora sp. KLBMP9576 TaxID=3424769 RepID=UPI003D929265
MAMVDQPAARRHRSRISYAFGLLALVGATIALVVAHDPALSATTRLATPVPAPEITVVDEDPPDDDSDPFGTPDALTGPGTLTGPDALTGPDETDALGAAGLPGTADDDSGTADEPGPAAAGAGAPTGSPGHRAARPSPDDTRRSLFWSGIFGLVISLAGLGLVGTRRRGW